MSMIRFRVAMAIALAAAVAATAAAQVVLPPDESKTVGTNVPPSWFLNENGDTLLLSDLAGAPLIISPVFTTCPHICPAITSGLVSALAGVGGVGETFNVLTVTFDPKDTADDLRKYREKTGIPPQWFVAYGDTTQVGSLLDAIDFHYVPLPAGGFAHPNAVAILSPDLVVSGYLHGMMHTEDEVRAALRIAAGHPPLVERARPWLILAAALGLLATALAIVLTSRRFR